MSVVALDRLEACQQGLIAALDGDDIDALESSITRLSHAIGDVRAAGAWHDQPDVVQRASRIAVLAEAARVRVNFLTDRTQRRLDQLAMLRGRGAPTYTPRPRQIA